MCDNGREDMATGRPKKSQQKFKHNQKRRVVGYLNLTRFRVKSGRTTVFISVPKLFYDTSMNSEDLHIKVESVEVDEKTEELHLYTFCEVGFIPVLF